MPDGSAVGSQPQPGLDTNPGIDAKLFAESHPYIANAYLGAQEAVQKVVRNTETKLIKRELRKAVQGQNISNPQFPHQILVSRASIDEWVNQPFKYMQEKAQMLFDIQSIISQAEYLGPAESHKDKEGVVQVHIFKTHVLDINAYIIVREYNSKEFILHSISDAQDFEKYIKRK